MSFWRTLVTRKPFWGIWFLWGSDFVAGPRRGSDLQPCVVPPCSFTLLDERLFDDNLCCVVCWSPICTQPLAFRLQEKSSKPTLAKVRLSSTSVTTSKWDTMGQSDPLLQRCSNTNGVQTGTHKSVSWVFCIYLVSSAKGVCAFQTQSKFHVLPNCEHHSCLWLALMEKEQLLTMLFNC